MDALDRFSQTLVREVMTPRPDVVAIGSAAPVSELRRLMTESKYSRIAVYGKDLDDIQGVVDVRDLLAFQGDPESPVAPLARPAHLVPETKRISELLREMQAHARDRGRGDRRVRRHGRPGHGRGHRRGAGRGDQGRVRHRGRSAHGRGRRQRDRRRPARRRAARGRRSRPSCRWTARSTRSAAW